MRQIIQSKDAEAGITYAILLLNMHLVCLPRHCSGEHASVDLAIYH